MTFEIELIRWMQSLGNGFWDAFFTFWTFFGEETVIIALMGFLYWCWDKKSGEYVGLTVFASQVANSVLKLGFQRLRPFQVDSSIRNVRPSTATGFSFPSGHTQGAASVFGSVALWFRKRWLSIASAVVIVMVAISRMYLGAHFLTDVLVGGLLGIGIAFGIQFLLERVKDRQKVYFWMLGGTILLLGIMTLVMLLTVEGTLEATDTAIYYDKLEGFYKMAGASFGFVFGIAYEKKKVGFANHRVWWKNAIRLGLGIGVVMAVRLGLSAVFDLLVNTDVASADNILFAGNFFPTTLGLFLDFLRYALMVFAGIGLVPLFFKKVNL